MECSSLASLSRIVLCFRVRQEPNQVKEHLSKIWARGEHSSLLQTLLNYGRKKFYNIAAWWSNMEEGREQHILKCQQVLEALTAPLEFRIFLDGD